jgi:hypothetical protein
MIPQDVLDLARVEVIDVMDVVRGEVFETAIVTCPECVLRWRLSARRNLGTGKWAEIRTHINQCFPF